MIFKISTILLLSTGITSPFAINLSNSQIPVPSDNPNAYHLDAHFIRPGSGDEFDAHINTINLT
jgi:hypothetical protein